VDANHCPGAVLLLLRLPDGRRIVHSGDMRYTPEMKGNRHLEAFRGADAVYLDTTYCSPKYTFPAQVWWSCRPSLESNLSRQSRSDELCLILFSALTTPSRAVRVLGFLPVSEVD